MKNKDVDYQKILKIEERKIDESNNMKAQFKGKRQQMHLLHQERKMDESNNMKPKKDKEEEDYQ